MRHLSGSIGWFGRILTGVLVVSLMAVVTADAHHAMGSRLPGTFGEGFLSGLGHPIIGIDHLAFVIAAGLAVGMAELNLAMLLVFVGASALGVAARVGGIAVPGAEAIVALTVLVAGVLLAWGGKKTAMARSATQGLLVLFAVAGLFHGYAYGEAVVGAEQTPLWAYLAGLAIVQTAIAAAVAWAVRRSGVDALQARLAAAAIAGVGLAVLAGQITPV
jgi:urease accessory protein